MKVASLPFFDEELPAGRRNRLAALRARRGLFGLALAVAIVGGTPGVLVMLRDVPGAAWGETTVAVGNTAETFVMARPAAGVQRTIGLKLELTGVSRGEDGRWQADVTVRDPATDGETVVTFRAGERSRLRDHMLSLSDVLPVPGAGRVVLTLTPVQGGTAEHVSFAVGMSHELPDGTVITVSDATLSFARQLGPAVRVVERRAEEVVSDRWVFASDATFDGRHAGGAWAVSLDDVEPQLAATFSVADVMLTPMQPGVAAVIWLGLVALCLGLTIRGGVIAVGRAGDYVLVAGGVLATGNAAESTARALLDADQNGERDAVLSAVAGSGA